MFAAVSLSGNRKPALGHNKRSSVPEDIPIRLAVTFAASRARVLQGERKLRDFHLARLQDIYCTVYFKTSGYSSLFCILYFAFRQGKRPFAKIWWVYLCALHFNFRTRVGFFYSFPSYDSNVRIRMGRREDSFPCQTCL